ncbi:Uncharacterised protein [Vibrio cholerae]|nr:Uncharacterised protein [Vibrio cholerae]
MPSCATSKLSGLISTWLVTNSLPKRDCSKSNCAGLKFETPKCFTLPTLCSSENASATSSAFISTSGRWISKTSISLTPKRSSE